MKTKKQVNGLKAEYQRKSRSVRRAGSGATCACGEARSEALIPESDPKICAKCDREAHGSTARDNHHNFGQSNSETTMSVPVNDHRAILSPAQYKWPDKTLSNPDGSPLLIGAAYIRGFGDTVAYLIDKFLKWVAILLELLDTRLEKKLGRKWWEHTIKGLEPET
jgi:hypothetical protein